MYDGIAGDCIVQFPQVSEALTTCRHDCLLWSSSLLKGWRAVYCAIRFSRLAAA